MPFEFKTFSIKGVVLVVPKVFEDSRGFFLETYEKNSFSKNGINFNVIQSNQSKSSRGVLRGLHFQKKEHAQAKLVKCLYGEIFDVAVDVRPDSDTFGKYVGVKLTDQNKNMLYIPRGFAHGFEVLSDSAEVAYNVDNNYAPEMESGLLWSDKTVGIDWPIKDPLLSDKDKKWPTLSQLK